MAYIKAKFKTAYLQREVPMNKKVAEGGTKVGHVVYDNSGTLTERETVASVVVGDMIIAQADMTLEYGHVPVENRNYAYSDAVAASNADKKVAVFVITNLDDVDLTLVS